MKTCMLCMPMHSRLIDMSSARTLYEASRDPSLRIVRTGGPCSLMAHGFNRSWAKALGSSYDYFAMLHADVCAPQGWLDTLILIMRANDADVVSAVTMIKGPEGVTSTGLSHSDPNKDWEPYRRFTLQEIHTFPPTFSSSDIGYPDRPLVVNTGCMVVNLGSSLFRETDDSGKLRIYFTINDGIFVREGRYYIYVEPEDWFFSRRVHRAGGKVMATREVVTEHIGFTGHATALPWGIQSDPVTAKRPVLDDEAVPE